MLYKIILVLTIISFVISPHIETFATLTQAENPADPKRAGIINTFL